MSGHHRSMTATRTATNDNRFHTIRPHLAGAVLCAASSLNLLFGTGSGSAQAAPHCSPQKPAQVCWRPVVNGHGTVKTATQRTSSPNLASQVGWFTPGTRLDLVCFTHGQPVKGFFSFNIPNGGWDNLWYRLGSGDYVADVDIETGTLRSVTPDCAAFDRSHPGYW